MVILVVAGYIQLSVVIGMSVVLFVLVVVQWSRILPGRGQCSRRTWFESWWSHSDFFRLAAESTRDDMHTTPGANPPRYGIYQGRYEAQIRGDMS